MGNKLSKYFQHETVYEDTFDKLGEKDKQKFKVVFKPDGTLELSRERHWHSFSIDGFEEIGYDSVSNTGIYEKIEDNENLFKIKMHLTQETSESSSSFKHKEILENQQIDKTLSFAIEKLRENKMGFSDSFLNKYQFQEYEDLYKQQLSLLQILGKTKLEDNIKEMIKYNGDFNKYLIDTYPQIKFDNLLELIFIKNIYHYDQAAEWKAKAYIAASHGNAYLAYESIVPKYKKYRELFKEIFQNEAEAFKYFTENEYLCPNADDYLDLYNGSSTYKDQLERMKDAGMENEDENIHLFFTYFKNVFLAIYEKTHDFSLVYKKELEDLEKLGYNNAERNLDTIKYFYPKDPFACTVENIIAYLNFVKEENWNILRLFDIHKITMNKPNLDIFFACNKDIYLTILKIKYPILLTLLETYDSNTLLNISYCLGDNATDLNNLYKIIEKLKKYFKKQGEVEISDNEVIRILREFEYSYGEKEYAYKVFKKEEHDYDIQNHLFIKDYALTDSNENLRYLRKYKGDFVKVMEWMQVPKHIAYNRQIGSLKKKHFHDEKLILEAIEHNLDDVNNIESMEAYCKIFSNQKLDQGIKEKIKLTIREYFGNDYKIALEKLEKNNYDFDLIYLEKYQPNVYESLKGKIEPSTLKALALKYEGDMEKIDADIVHFTLQEPKANQDK